MAYTHIERKRDRIIKISFRNLNGIHHIKTT